MSGDIGIHVGPDRNAEKQGCLVLIGSRSSIVGGPGERKLGENAK